MVIPIPWAIPFGSLSFGVDRLSAFFLFPIAMVGGLGAVYAGGYLRRSSGVQAPRFFWFFYSIFFAFLLLVVTARNGLLFLMAWEGRSLASFFLVMVEHREPTVRSAGWTYLIAAHLGTACLLALFILLGDRNPTQDFEGFGVSGREGIRSLLFLLALIGFGVKAGMVPWHVWLPEAHPAAPSPVSAVMSGVMIKTGIYGLLRIMMFLGEPTLWPAWWGWTLVGLGALSGVGGVLLALAQKDLKRLLAYSSVENIGVISLGLGLWLCGVRVGNPAMAALGLWGALLHVWNHAVFKSLLFMSAGAVAHATGTRSLDRLGGLIHGMPFTSLAFFAGSVSLCGLPPFNGFISELLLYGSALAGILQPEGLRRIPVLAVGALGLMGGLALACFATAFGIGFLGQARSEEAAQAHEVSFLIAVPMGVAAVVCLGIGLMSPLAVAFTSFAAFDLMPILPGVIRVGGWEIPALFQRILVANVALCVMLVVLMAARRILLLHRRVEESSTWDCGYAAPTARMQYTASSFIWDILAMARVLRPRVKECRPLGLFPRSARLGTEEQDIFQRLFYNRLWRGIERCSDRLRRLQEGRNQIYVLYLALTVLALLLWKLGFSQ